MSEPTEETQPIASTSDPRELAADGLRLIKAFLRIADPDERTLVIEFAERLASPNNSTTN